MPGEDDIESETEEPGTPTPPPPPRSAGPREPVAWHSMPEHFWQEILFDFKVGAVIDLTLADGLFAQAALHARIPYTGLVFTKRHADELLQRLQSFVLARATREGDTRGIANRFDEAEGEQKSQNQRHFGDKCRDKATKEEKGEACNKALGHRTCIQDGKI